MSYAATSRVAAARPRSGSTFTGTPALTRFALRRERWSIAGWAVGLALLTALVPLSYVAIYPTAEQRQLVAGIMSSPAAVAMMGVNHAEGDYHYGAMTSHQMLFFSAILVAVMSVLLTVRHTRQEEATGRAELVRSSVVGRHAPTAAAMLTALAANVAVGAALALGLGATGALGIDWGGSWLYGAAHVAVGMAFAGVAAVAAQAFESPRAATAAALALLGLAYMLRAAGDVAGNGLEWFSPLGWAQATQPYVNDLWAPLLLAVAFAAAMTAVALVLVDRRDVGAGLRAARPGPARAAAALTTPIGFAWRLHRGTIIAWAVGNLVMGAMYGAFLSDIDSMLAGSDVLEQMFGDVQGPDMAVTFGAVISAVMAVIVSAYAVLATSRLRSEETAGRAEPLLSTTLSRARWMTSHAAVVALGSLIVLIGGGLGLGSAGSATLGDWSMLPRFAGAVVAYAPSHWVVIGVVALLFGLAPRYLPLAWGLVGFSFVVIYLGELLQLPAALRALSPFEPVPDMPAEGFAVLPLLALTLVALTLVAAGVAAFRRRDVPA